MTDEELEKKAKDFELSKHYRYEDNDYCGDIANGIIQAYIAGAKEMQKENERAKVLLKATLDLLQKQKDSYYVLNLLENTVFYDEAECDGYCLFDDIENFLNDEG